MKKVMIDENLKAKIWSCNTSKNKWLEIYTDFSEDSSPELNFDNKDDTIDTSIQKQ